MAGVRGSQHPESPELLQRLQNIERILGITGQQNGPGLPNVAEITGHHRTRDASGLLRVQLGELQTGDFGLGVTDPNGVYQEVFPLSCAQAAGGTASTAAGTPGALQAGGLSPSVTCYLGASGDALITVSCTISPPAGGGLGQVYFLVDGNVSLGAWLVFEAQLSAGADSGASCSISQRLSQSNTTAFQKLAPQTDHTFTLEYAGTSVAFGGVCLTVQPL